MDRSPSSQVCRARAAPCPAAASFIRLSLLASGLAVAALAATPLVATTAAAAPSAPAGAAVADDDLTRGLKLLMVEEPGCGFCLRWMAEVAPGYRLSSEGLSAPLVIRDRGDPEVRRFGRIVYTPTFILLRDGVERGRILGYPGPDFFWSLLGEMLRRETERRETEAGDGAAKGLPQSRP